MPIVVRDKNGCIVSVLAETNPGDGSRFDASDAELSALFAEGGAGRELQEVLVASDLSFVRVLEDLIGVLIDKGVIMLTDLPEAAREKLLERQETRGHLANLGGLITGETEDDCPI